MIKLLEKQIPIDRPSKFRNRSKSLKKKKKKNKKKKKKKRSDSSSMSDYCPRSLKRKMKSQKAKLEAEREVNVILVADQLPKRKRIKSKKFKEYLEIMKDSEAPKTV